MLESVQLPKNAPDNSLDHSMIEVEEILQKQQKLPLGPGRTGDANPN